MKLNERMHAAAARAAAWERALRLGRRLGAACGIRDVGKVKLSKIDLRARTIFFKHEVRTYDNVRMNLEGTIFWQVHDLPKMINATDDPEGDVWHHARSALIEAVSNTTLATFMAGFNGIVMEASRKQSGDGFYAERGVELQSMEVTRYDCTDEKTATGATGGHPGDHEPHQPADGAGQQRRGAGGGARDGA